MSLLQAGGLDPDTFWQGSYPENCGAHLLFAGTVRNIHEGEAVTAIHYHAYTPLAEKALLDIQKSIAQEFGVICRVLHATGLLQVGEVSVLVGCRGGHRAEVFEACRMAMERIKSQVPVWKEEFFADGRVSFVKGVPIQAAAELLA